MSAYDTYFEEYEHQHELREMEEQKAKRRILKPCRDCGGMAELMEEREWYFNGFLSLYYVVCTKCNKKTDTSCIDFSIVDEWNKAQ